MKKKMERLFWEYEDIIAKAILILAAVIFVSIAILVLAKFAVKLLIIGLVIACSLVGIGGLVLLAYLVIATIEDIRTIK